MEAGTGKPFEPSTSSNVLIEAAEALHPDHKNRLRILNVLQWYQKNQALHLQSHGTSKFLSESEQTSLYISKEIERAPAKSIRFRDILSGQDEGTKKQFLSSFRAFGTTPVLIRTSPM